VQGLTYPYDPSLRQRILDLCDGASLSPEQWAALDDAIGETFGAAAIAVQDAARAEPGHGLEAIAPSLIGSHGQTVFHRPPSPPHLGYSLQLGRGAIIAHRTGLATVTNFRAADLAQGGQGAPLVPPVDACLLGHPTEWRCVQNLGGIGNVTVLPPQSLEAQGPLGLSTIRGWDTGPANSLLDWAAHHLSGGEKTYDAGGAWAAQGHIDAELVQQWLSHDFFQQPPPKSTGRELFGDTYSQACWQQAQGRGLGAADFLATLTEFTALSIVHSYRTWLPQLPDRVLLCGGGSHNHFLRQRLQHHLPQIPLETTTAWGLDADFKEAMLFAVLAHWHHQGMAGNLPSVTGARQPVILGDWHSAPSY